MRCDRFKNTLGLIKKLSRSCLEEDEQRLPTDNGPFSKKKPFLHVAKKIKYFREHNTGQLKFLQTFRLISSSASV